MFEFIGIDSWQIYDRKFFVILPNFISILLFIVTAIVNKTVPSNIEGYDNFKEEISSNLFAKH